MKRHHLKYWILFVVIFLALILFLVVVIGALIFLVPLVIFLVLVGFLINLFRKKKEKRKDYLDVEYTVKK